MKTTKHLLGRKIGRLLAIRLSHRDAKRGSYFEFLCDCGNKKVICASDVVFGSTKSCGCLRKEGQQRRLPDGVAASNVLYNSYKNNARQRIFYKLQRNRAVIAEFFQKKHSLGVGMTNTLRTRIMVSTESITTKDIFSPMLVLVVICATELRMICPCRNSMLG